MRLEFSAGAAVYTQSSGQTVFLFLKRKEGWLDVPKGHIERGEDARAAALREIKEESGLTVELDDHFRRDIEYWFVKGGEKVKKHVTFFLAKAPRGAEVRISKEHVGYEWLGVEDALKRSSFKNQAGVITAANEYASRLREIERLNSDYGRLPASIRPWGLSRRLVPGEGPLDAKVMFVGQAPGASEDEEGRPFVGISGRLLDTLIARAGMKRGEVYITSLVQFFPPANRVPTEDEAAACRPFFDAQVGVIKPRLMVLLGNFASVGVAGAGVVGARHGTVVACRQYNCEAFITYHPAAAVRIKKLMPVISRDFDMLKEVVAKL